MLRKVLYFKKTPKGYYYINDKRVNQTKYEYYSNICTRKDTFLSSNGFQYHVGYIYE